MNETTYTTEDLATATEARHPETGQTATRDRTYSDGGPNLKYPWQSDIALPHGTNIASDRQMSSWGFIPGPRPVEQDDEQGDYEDIGTPHSRQKLINHVASLDSVIRKRNVEITRLRQALSEAESANESNDAPENLLTAYRAARSALRDSLVRPDDDKIHAGEEYVELHDNGRIEGPLTSPREIGSEIGFGFACRLLAPRAEEAAPDWEGAEVIRATYDGRRGLLARDSDDDWVAVGLGDWQEHVGGYIGAQFARRELSDVEIIA